MGAIFITGDDTGTVFAESGIPATGDLFAWEWDLLAGFPSDEDLDDPVVAVWSIASPPEFGTVTFVPDAIGATTTWVYSLDDDHPAVQDLELGESLTDSFLIRAVGGVGDEDLLAGFKEVTITVFGVCIAAGTLIETAEGLRPVEELAVGQQVATRDNGLQDIQWVDGSKIEPERWQTNPALLPVKISKGALGASIPERDLYVSQQHRILVSGAAMELLFGEAEVLVAAKDLCRIPGIEITEPAGELEYHHILCSRHQILNANGAPVESLFLGDEALMRMGGAALTELLEIFGEGAGTTGKSAFFGQAARRILTGQESKVVYSMATAL